MKKIDLKGVFNNRGLTSINDSHNGKLTVTGNSFPIEEVCSNGVLDLFDTTCKKGDNFYLEEQKIILDEPIIATKLLIIGVSVYGDYFGDVEIRLNSRQITKIRIELTNLLSELPFFSSNKSVVKSNYLNSNGEKYEYVSNIWKQEIDIGFTVTFDELFFFDNPFIHIFSIFYI